jgi:prepilin-type N-terminal cleavage/methylation domain-containing protein
MQPPEHQIWPSFSFLNDLTETFMRKRPGSHGFTLIEIMIVVSIVALLATIAIPSFMRARKRAQASRVLKDLQVLSDALDQYAIEHNKTPGAAANFTDLQAYIKQGTPLYVSNGLDLFGNTYNNSTVFIVDKTPKVPDRTFHFLSDVAPPEFWSPFK